MRTTMMMLVAGALLLAACSRSPGPSSVPSVPVSSVVATPSEQVVPEPVGSVGIMTCHDAFTSLSPITIQEITGLSDAGELLDATIEHCSTLQAWKTGLQAVLPSLDLANARDFVIRRCTANPQLTPTPLCQSLAR